MSALQPKVIKFNSNGTTVAYDKSGNQINDYNFSWLRSYLNFLKAFTVDVESIEFIMPNGALKAKITKKDDQLDWLIESRWDKKEE